MHTRNINYLELASHSIQCFTHPGKFDLHDVDELMDIALRDGKVTDDEKRVLKNIFDRLTDTELTTRMRKRLCEVRQEFDL